MGCFRSTKKFSTVSTKANLWMVCLLGGLSKVWGFGFRGLGFRVGFSGLTVPAEEGLGFGFSDSLTIQVYFGFYLEGRGT